MYYVPGINPELARRAKTARGSGGTLDTVRYVESILSTTHADCHGERFSHESLLGAVEQVRRGYVPMMFNHDPRFPPIGRLVDAEV